MWAKVIATCKGGIYIADEWNFVRGSHNDIPHLAINIFNLPGYQLQILKAEWLARTFGLNYETGANSIYLDKIRALLQVLPVNDTFAPGRHQNITLYFRRHLFFSALCPRPELMKIPA